MHINEIKKDILRSKAVAVFAYYSEGKLYYNIALSDGLYQFPVDVVEPNIITITGIEKGVRIKKTIETITLSEDLGITHFDREIKGSLLGRWIQKANDKELFILIKQNVQVVELNSKRNMEINTELRIVREEGVEFFEEEKNPE